MRPRTGSTTIGEIKIAAITAAVIRRNSILMSQTSDLIAQSSTIVICRSDLQDRHHENHQKHRHAFARGLLNHRRSFRVRLKSGSSDLSALLSRTGGGHFYSHRQIRGDRLQPASIGVPRPFSSTNQVQSVPSRSSTREPRSRSQANLNAGRAGPTSGPLPDSIGNCVTFTTGSICSPARTTELTQRNE